MTETGILHREDTGTLMAIRVVDPLGVGNVEIDPDLPLGFANAIETWLREEHGYDYADVIARSAGARAEGRARLEMMGILDPIDVAPRVQLQIFADSSPFDTEMERVISEMPDLPEQAVVDGEIVTIDDFAPAADEQLPGVPSEELHKQALETLDEIGRRHALEDAAREGTRTGRYRAPRQLHEKAVQQQGRRSWSDEWAAFRADVRDMWYDLTAWWPWRRS